MQAAGESMADVKASLSSAAASARQTVDRDDTPAASSAPAESAPAAPAPAAPAPTDPAPPTCTPTGLRRTPRGRSRSPTGGLVAARPALLSRVCGREARPQRMAEIGTLRVKTSLAEMLKGGVIMDVVDAEQARVAEEAGACAVMALRARPTDIRRDGGVARLTRRRSARSRSPSRSRSWRSAASATSSRPRSSRRSRSTTSTSRRC